MSGRTEHYLTSADVREILEGTDDAYLKAAEAGDIETCRRMVDAAAAAAGYTIRAAHSTNAPEFKEFRTQGLRAHFGSVTAAEDRARILRDFSLNVVKRPHSDARVLHVFLKIENPLRMKDMASIESEIESDEGPPIMREWESETDFQEVLYEMGAITVDEFWEVQYDVDAAVELLKRDGYDGIEYVNAVEDAGSTSYIIFDPNQVKLSDPIVKDENGIVPLSRRFTPSPLITEGSGRLGVDVDPTAATEDEISALSVQNRKRLSQTDETLRQFHVKISFPSTTVDTWTHAASAEEALRRVLHRKSIQSGYRSPKLAIYAVQTGRAAATVADDRWQYTYRYPRTDIGLGRMTESREMPPHVSKLYAGADEQEGVEFTPEALERACEEDHVPVVFNAERTEAVVAGRWWFDVDPQYPRVDDVGSWIYGVSEYALEDWGIKPVDFNQQFWEYPSPLYHATSDDNVESIKEHGIHARNDTRGITNRSVGSAVFTSIDSEELLHGSYGDHIFEIDCSAMKKDGLMPLAEQEPDVEEYEWRRALLTAVGAEQVADRLEVSSDMSPNTVILYGAIPPKYLTLT